MRYRLQLSRKRPNSVREGGREAGAVFGGFPHEQHCDHLTGVDDTRPVTCGFFV